MKKHAIGVMIVVCLATILSLSGCGTTETKSTDDTTSDTQQQETQEITVPDTDTEALPDNDRDFPKDGGFNIDIDFDTLSEALEIDAEELQAAFTQAMNETLANTFIPSGDNMTDRHMPGDGKDMTPPEGMEVPDGMEPPEGMESPEGMERPEGEEDMPFPQDEPTGEDRPAFGDEDFERTMALPDELIQKIAEILGIDAQVLEEAIDNMN